MVNGNAKGKRKITEASFEHMIPGSRQEADIDVITFRDYLIMHIPNNTPLLNNTVDIYVNGSSILNSSNRYSDQTINASIISSSGNTTVTVTTWNTTGDYYKKWNESSSNASTTTQHIIGDFPANTNVQIKRDGINYAQLTSNTTGYINWTYSGGYSEHQFEAELAVSATPLSWSNDTSAIDLWVSIGKLIIAMVIIFVVSFIYIVFRGINSKTFIQLIDIGLGIMALVIIYSIISIVGGLISGLM